MMRDMVGPSPSAPRRALKLPVLLAVGAFEAGMLAERPPLDSQCTDALRRHDQALHQHRQPIVQSDRGGSDLRPAWRPRA